jgi:hypothetical protein
MSASPATVPALNFTLCGAPAPRSAHRTSSGAAKAKPRRRSIRPTAAPPASPVITDCCTCCTDVFRLDLSSLAADEFESVTSRPNGRQRCCIDDGAVINESGNEYSDTGIGIRVGHTDNGGPKANKVNQNPLNEEFDNIQHTGKSKEWLGYEKDSEGKLCKNQNLPVNAGSGSTGSQYSDRDRPSTDLISSSRAFSDQGANSVRSCLSDSSSYVTLSENSVDSYSRNYSYSSRESHGSGIHISSGSESYNESSCDLMSDISRTNEISEDGSVVIPEASPRKMISAKAARQLIRSFPDGNLSLEPHNSRHKESWTQNSSGVTSKHGKSTGSPVTVPPRCKDNARVSKLASLSTESRTEGSGSLDISPILRNEYGLNSNATESSRGCSEANMNKSEFIENKYIANDRASDNDENVIIFSSVVYGHCCLNEGHTTLPKEWPIEEEKITDQLPLCCARSMETCKCLLNCSKSDESNNREVPNSDTCKVSASCSRNENHFDEKSDEIAVAIEMSSQNKTSIAGRESVTPHLNSRATFQTHTFLTNLEDNEDFSGTFENFDFKCQKLYPNKEFGRNVYSVPTGTRISNMARNLSELICDCESGGNTRILLEPRESGYNPCSPVSDISLSAGEFTEAVHHARQLVRVLGRALDSALSQKTNRTNTELPLDCASITRRKQRSRSLSPNILRRSKRSDSIRSPGATELSLRKKDSVSRADTDTNNKKGVDEEHTSDVKPSLSGDSVGSQRCYYGGEPYTLHVSPEQLRKQRALLRPAVDRRRHGAVVQMLDMADILKNAITQRRKFMDPSEEFTCGTNRSGSDCSLEGT